MATRHTTKIKDTFTALISPVPHFVGPKAISSTAENITIAEVKPHLRRLELELEKADPQLVIELEKQIKAVKVFLKSHTRILFVSEAQVLYSELWAEIFLRCWLVAIPSHCMFPFFSSDKNGGLWRYPCLVCGPHSELKYTQESSGQWCQS